MPQRVDVEVGPLGVPGCTFRVRVDETETRRMTHATAVQLHEALGDALREHESSLAAWYREMGLDRPAAA